jgi:hypothetical protein
MSMSLLDAAFDFRSRGVAGYVLYVVTLPPPREKPDLPRMQFGQFALVAALRAN